MKKLMRLIVLGLLVIAPMLTSCSKDDDDRYRDIVDPPKEDDGLIHSDIVGIWYNSSLNSFDLYFETGKFEHYAHGLDKDEDGNVTEYYDYWVGTYTIDPELLTITYNCYVKDVNGDIDYKSEVFDFNYQFEGPDFFEQTYYEDFKLRTERLERVTNNKDVQYLGVRKEVETYFNLRR